MVESRPKPEGFGRTSHVIGRIDRGCPKWRRGGVGEGGKATERVANHTARDAVSGISDIGMIGGGRIADVRRCSELSPSCRRENKRLREQVLEVLPIPQHSHSSHSAAVVSLPRADGAGTVSFSGTAMRYIRRDGGGDGTGMVAGSRASRPRQVLPRSIPTGHGPLSARYLQAIPGYSRRCMWKRTVSAQGPVQPPQVKSSPRTLEPRLLGNRFWSESSLGVVRDGARVADGERSRSCRPVTSTPHPTVGASGAVVLTQGQGRRRVDE